MTVQDNERERELVRLFNLQWDAAHQRSGVDAFLDVQTSKGKFRFEVEVKSSTGGTVSTARDVGMDHIQKWRRKKNFCYWVLLARRWPSRTEVLPVPHASGHGAVDQFDRAENLARFSDREAGLEKSSVG